MAEGSILFGLIDNGVLLMGACFGLEVERLFPNRLRCGMGAVIGAGLGNAVSDFLGGLPIGLDFATGTAVGCIAALAALPIIHLIKKSR